jgi:signal transduction histidine kinase
MTMSNGKNVELQTTGVHEYDELMAAFSKTSLLLLDGAKEKQRADAAEAALSERKKIFSHMHDSLGASLVDLIFHLRHATDWKGAQQKERQTLTELRLLVDSSLPESETIESVLAGGRHRMESAMELAGVKVVWKVEELPSRPILTPECTLNLRLILMEVLNNIIQHAAAKTAIISASCDKNARVVTVSIADDGRGFELASVRIGHGLQNIRARTKKLLLPSTVSIDSNPGKGTTVLIKIDWPADELGNLDRQN